MDREPLRPTGRWSWRDRRARSRRNPLDYEIGLGGSHPMLRLLGLWALGIGVIVGLSVVLSRQAAGIIALVIILGLLTTVRI